MKRKYIVHLTDDKRLLSMDTVKKLKGTSQKVKRAQILFGLI